MQASASATAAAAATTTFNPVADTHVSSGQPAIDGVTLGSLGSVSRNTWYEINVSAYVTTGNGTFSIGVTSSSSDGADYDSRETGATAPQLVITTGGPAPSPSPTTTTTPPPSATSRKRAWSGRS